MRKNLLSELSSRQHNSAREFLRVRKTVPRKVSHHPRPFKLLFRGLERSMNNRIDIENKERSGDRCPHDLHLRPPFGPVCLQLSSKNSGYINIGKTKKNGLRNELLALPFQPKNVLRAEIPATPKYACDIHRQGTVHTRIDCLSVPHPRQLPKPL